MKPYRLDRNDIIPWNEAVAYILGMVTVVFPALAYWQYGGEALFGRDHLAKLLLIAGPGGALSAALHAGRRYWAWVLLPGALVGVGAAGLHVWYTEFFSKTSLWDLEFALILMIGAIPGLLLLLLVLALAKKREAAREPELFPEPGDISGVS